MVLTHPRNREDFEVALICALRVERDAVEALLDEEYETDGFSYGKADGDDNAYTTGRMGNQHVVLAYMPVVGICGGVPRLADGTEILLGDIIIGEIAVQIDFGRRYPNKFIRKDNLEDNLPRAPLEIRTFLGRTAGQSVRRRLWDKTALYTAELCRKRGFENSTYPGAGSDKLFPPDYRHKHQDPISCAICAGCQAQHGSVCATALTSSCAELGCDERLLIDRGRVQRAKGLHLDGSAITDAAEVQEAQKPSIHFGRVASGDGVMKSGQHRDEIAAAEKIIAFEMESAGAWDKHPTLVVKSVCDYADDHKNKEWQAYAAATAAACTKALLGEWRSTKRPPKRPLSPELFSMSRNKRRVSIFAPENVGGEQHDMIPENDGEIEDTNPGIETDIINKFECYGRQAEHTVATIQQSKTNQDVILKDLSRKVASIEHYLLSRPALLNSTYQRLDMLQSQGSSDLISPIQAAPLLNQHPQTPRQIGCSCRRSQRRVRRQYSSGRFVAFGEVNGHEKYCFCCISPWDQISLGVKLSFSAFFVSKAIHASILFNRGYGGLSISPHLAWNPIVPSDAPHFALVCRLRCGITRAAVEEVLRQLREMFINGEASPRDIGEDGGSLFLYACRLIGHISLASDTEGYTACCMLLRCLVEWGAPLNEIWRNHTPLGSLMMLASIITNTLDSSAGLERIAANLAAIGSELVARGAEFSPPVAHSSITWRYQHLKLMEKSEDLAEACECGNLSKAILRKPIDDVNRIFCHDPNVINERNLHGLTPFHLAADRPEAFALLLLKDQNYVLDQTDNKGFTPLRYACAAGNQESLRLLLRAGCTLSSAPLSFKSALNSGSSCQKTMLIDALAKRRRQLRRLWSICFRSGFDHCDANNVKAEDGKEEKREDNNRDLFTERVPDVDAGQLCSDLMCNGFEVPRYLQAPIHKTTVFHIQSQIPGYQFLQLEYLTPSVADYLFASGFRDVDEYDHAGLTPLMSISQNKMFVGDYGLEYGAWLISRGASLSREPQQFQSTKPRPRNSTALHFWAAAVGRSLSLRPKMESDSWWLLFSLLSLSISDDCTCACSTSGCAALTAYFKASYEGADYWYNLIWDYSNTIVWELLGSLSIPESFLHVVRELPVVYPAELQRQVLRLLTFERLGLRHTCCKLGWDGDAYVFLCRDEEYIKEIREEEALLLEKFYNLMEMFQGQFDELKIPLGEFLQQYWDPLMKEEECGSSDAWDEEEVRRIEEIGVVLEK